MGVQQMPNFRGNEDLCKLDKEYLNDLLCKFGPFCLQHSETFDIWHAFLQVNIAELSTLKQVQFFGPPCIYLRSRTESDFREWLQSYTRYGGTAISNATINASIRYGNSAISASSNFAFKIAARPLQTETWLLLTACRNSSPPYAMVKSSTPYDVPLSYSTARLAWRRA